MAKVTISIPDGIERRARVVAQQTHRSFSAVMSQAVEEYADRLEKSGDRVTEQINAALAASGGDDSNLVAIRASRSTLSQSEW